MSLPRRGFLGGMVSALAAPMLIGTGIVTLPYGSLDARRLDLLYRRMKEAENRVVRWAIDYSGPLLGADLAANVVLGKLINQHHEATRAWTRAAYDFDGLR